MKLIDQTETHFYYESYFEGQKVSMMQDKKTGELHVNADDAAKIFGYGSLEQMMLDDAVLDALNQEYKEKGVFPISKV